MRSKLKLPICLFVVLVLAPVASADARSSIRVGLADQNAAMFDSPYFQQLKIKRTRYFVPSDVMQNAAVRARATAFVDAARSHGVSTLLHISTTDLRAKKGPIVSTTSYRSNAAKIVTYFRKLGVREFGAWNEENNATEETYNHVGNAVSYFKSMWSAVHARCSSCTVVGLDVLDQAGVEGYIRSFYARLSSTWRKRLTIVGIHNYSDVNRSRSSGTSKIITAVRHYNAHTKFWFTETGALASFQGSFPYSESRQASRMKNMFTLASRFRSRGVQRVYSYNFTGIESSTACGKHCLFDSGLMEPNGTPRPVFSVFKQKLAGYSR
jgi:hypothetical protein